MPTLRQLVGLSVAVGLVVGCARGEHVKGAWVQDLTFKGNKVFSDRTLRGKLATERTGWWPLAARRWHDPAALDMDLQRIPAFYADQGYFDARVTDHDIIERAGGSVDIVITIKEGEPTKIEKVNFVGSANPAQVKRIQSLAESWDVSPGKLARYEDYSTFKRKAQDRLRADGYAYGTLDSNLAVDRDRHAATVNLKARPGPLVHMGQTSIEGNGGIPAWKLLRRVTWKPGDLYDPRDLAATQGRLYYLGVFSSVRIELPPEPIEIADVRIRVTPGQLHELKLGGGLGVERQREEVRLRASWTFSDFLGGLRKLRLRAKPAYVVIPSVTNPQRTGPAAELDAQLTQPDIFGTNASLRGMAGYDLLITEGYQAHGPRGQVGFDRPFFRDRVQAGVDWNLQYLDFFNINRDVFDAQKTSLGFGFKDPYRLAYLEEFAQLDLRDSVIDPRYGCFLALRFEQGSPLVGGDFRYIKVTPELRGYVPLARRVVIAARGLVGWLNPLVGGTGTDSPVTRRYQAGGPSSHRGFGFGRLSPQLADQKNRLIPVGGDGELLFSLDLRIDLLQLADNWLGIVPFVDAGDVTARFDQLSLRRLHYATGLSLEYTTPIGIIRGGAGVRLNRLSGAAMPGMSPENPDPGQRFAFHITIGEAF